MNRTYQIVTGSIKRRMEQNVQDKDVDKLLAYLSLNYSPETRAQVYSALGRVPCRKSLDALVACAADLSEPGGRDWDIIAASLARIYDALGAGPLQIVSELYGTGLTSDVLSRITKPSDETLQSAGA